MTADEWKIIDGLTRAVDSFEVQVALRARAEPDALIAVTQAREAIRKLRAERWLCEAHGLWSCRPCGGERSR